MTKRQFSPITARIFSLKFVLSKKGCFRIQYNFLIFSQGPNLVHSVCELIILPRRTFSLKCILNNENTTFSVSDSDWGCWLQVKKIKLKPIARLQRCRSRHYGNTGTVSYGDLQWRGLCTVCLRPLTFASVLVESSNPATIVDQRAVVEEECGGTVRQSPVVEMIKSGKYQIYRRELQLSSDQTDLQLYWAPLGGPRYR